MGPNGSVLLFDGDRPHCRQRRPSVIKAVKLENLPQIIRGRLGLIVGPAVTLYPGVLRDLRDTLARSFSFPLPNSGTFLDVADQLVCGGKTANEIRKTVCQFQGEQQPSAVVSHLSKARWSAVLSASLDNYFEDKLQTEAQRRPNRRPVAVFNDLAQMPPPRVLPVFKLLGMQNRSDFPISQVEFMQRRAQWRYATACFSERVKGSPILCVGMADCDWVLLELLAELFASRTSTPSDLLFLSDDPVIANEKLPALVGARTRLHRLQATTGDVIRTITDAEGTGYAPVHSFREKDVDLQVLQPHQDLAAVVNSQLDTGIKVEERNQLTDILFAPSINRWDPFVHSLDLPRTATQTAFQQILGLLSREIPAHFACVITGNAATGKTTVLKRLAFDLAKRGSLTLWLKPWFYSDTNRVARGLFNDVAKLSSEYGKQVLLFVDDPSALNVFNARLLQSAAESAGLVLGLIVGMRTSEWKTANSSDMLGGLVVEYEDEVSDQLDDEEWNLLPDYLVTLEICDSTSIAQQECERVSQRSAHDTLSMLYYLLPATRGAITGSIKDEYYRLGDLATLRRVLLGATEHTTDLLKSAYEMVAVANHYKVALPIEVLVSALDVDYSAWLDVASHGGPAWGIVYGDEDNDGGVCYHTRNDLVTKTLIDAMNGGLLGHSGELRVLSKLVCGCTGRSSPVYREFCVRILVPHKYLEHLEYEEGLGLYDDALKALPYPDKTIVHHKGLWVKNKGKNAALALTVLTQALATEAYPYTDREEANQHVHTSLAATTLDSVDQGKKDLRTAKEEVLDHLRKGQSGFFNANAVHVKAGLILRLIEFMEQSSDEHRHADEIALISDAVGDIDRFLIILRATTLTRHRAVQDLNMLEKRRDDLLSATTNIGDLQKEAERLWDSYGRQEGFVLWARQLFEQARQSNKGKLFKKAADYCNEVRERIKGRDVPVSGAMSEVELLIIYYWRVIRGLKNPSQEDIDWERIRELAIETLQLNELADHTLYRFIHAFALAHLGHWVDANGMFHRLRQSGVPNEVLWTPRAFLLDTKGGPKRIQGKMRSSGQRSYLYAEDLHADFHTARDEYWPREGEIAHSYIRFAFAGPTATQEIF